MSMIGMHIRLAEEDLNRLRVICEEDDEDGYCDILEELEEQCLVFDSDKDWHMMHALLAGKLWEGKGPLGRAVLGGTEISEDRGTIFGYGPPRFLTKAQVKSTYNALKKLSPEQLQRRFTSKPYAELKVYPGEVALKDVGDWADQIISSVEELTEFFKSSQGWCVLFVLN